MTSLKSEPQYFYFNQLPSTNSKLKELVQEKDLPEFSIVLTPDQTAGRGQIGNAWESQKDMNLTFSLLLRPVFLEPQNQFYISKIISLAIIDTLKPIISETCIKWPNDIYINDQKLAGILIENSLMGASINYSIAGIGLNVNQEHFISEAKNPVSIKNITGEQHNLKKLLQTFIRNLQEWYYRLQNEQISQIDQTYINHLYRSKGYHSFIDQSGQFKAKFKGILPTGNLILEDEQAALRTYAFKEVEFVI